MQKLLSSQLQGRLLLACKEKAAHIIDAGIDPQLAVILVGQHPDSVRYVALKTEMAKKMGIILSLYHFEETATYDELVETISFLNADEDIHGVIIQLPLPSQFTDQQTDALLALVDPKKDVDGLTGSWIEEIGSAITTDEIMASKSFLPPMVGSVLSLLDSYAISLPGKKIVLIGRGRLVGGPLEAYFKKVGFDVVSVDEETNNILDITKQADILISGTGQNDIVTYQWVKEGAIVIDCAQDIHEDSVSQVAASLAPSRGGVGPLTILWLLHNTLLAASKE